MDARDVLAKLRTGIALSRGDITWFANALADGGVDDAQAGAFAMGICRNPMAVADRVALTLAMRDTGSVLRWDLPGPVVDSADIRRDPEGMLRKLCDVIGLDFDPAVLAWEAGPTPFDRAWAPHWYGAVHRSTGFAGAEGPLPQLDGEAAMLVEAALPHYEALREKAI